MPGLVSCVGALLASSAAPGFPVDISRDGWKVDALYVHVLWITGVAFVALEAILLFFLVKYRARPGVSPLSERRGAASVVWGVFIAAVALTLTVTEGQAWQESNRVLIEKRVDIPHGKDVFRVEVFAEQFQWNFRFPGPSGAFGTPQDLTSVGILHVPVGRPVVLQMRSKDVIHSFFLPNLREKQDVVPGLTTQIWFEATKEGQYEIACAELCGLGHYTMRAFLHVDSEEKLAAWLKGQEQYRSSENTWGWEWQAWGNR